jgi:molybdopterin converting factor small subunit
MAVTFEMTKRLAEMAGLSRCVEVGDGRTLGEALQSLSNRLREAGANTLLQNGDLHPSILVVVDGEARSAHDRDLPLAGGETIDLLLPIAGG